jgi:hypothetical protein
VCVACGWYSSMECRTSQTAQLASRAKPIRSAWRAACIARRETRDGCSSCAFEGAARAACFLWGALPLQGHNLHTPTHETTSLTAGQGFHKHTQKGKTSSRSACISLKQTYTKQKFSDRVLESFTWQAGGARPPLAADRDGALVEQRLWALLTVLDHKNIQRCGMESIGRCITARSAAGGAQCADPGAKQRAPRAAASARAPVWTRPSPAKRARPSSTAARMPLSANTAWHRGGRTAESRAGRGLSFPTALCTDEGSALLARPSLPSPPPPDPLFLADVPAGQGPAGQVVQHIQVSGPASLPRPASSTRLCMCRSGAEGF